MKGFSKLTRVEEAQKIIHDLSSIKGISSESVGIIDANGRILVRDIVSGTDVPPFDRSAVDGYALISEDALSASHSNPAILKLIGTSEAGSGQRKLSRGECIEIFTGAQIPDGADAVIMAEDTSINGNRVSLFKAVPKYANISISGEDLRKGEMIIAKGTLLKPWHIGVLASIGCDSVVVKKRPKIGLFSTGKELVDITESHTLAQGSIFDSTKPMLICLLKEMGCNILDFGIVEDSIGDIAKALKKLGCSDADAIITIGGTSLGRKDLVPEAAKSISERGIIFHGLAIKPGKPAGFGIIDNKPLFILPGYPVSALVGFENLVQPLIYSWLERRPPEREKVSAIMSRAVPTSPGIRHFLRVQLRCEDEQMKAIPLAITGSGMLSSITRADGIVIVKEDLEGLEEGCEVEVELI
ncbi:MAG: molybdopterin molybdotransferase MoeA [Candidatus Methanomethylicus sp.]|nr:molybdopterin molybdotransferase MoeA [Candidatus Methanomethylicus sp.]